MASNKLSAMIGHGVQAGQDTLGDRFEMMQLHIERAPVFVSNERAGADISTKDLRNILVGEVSNWAQLGRGEGDIQVYLHGGSMQRVALRVLLARTLEVAPANLERLGERVHYVGGNVARRDRERKEAAEESYQQLAEAAAADVNCLAMGIKDLEPRGLKMLEVNDEPITSKSYPLVLPIYLIWEKSDAGVEGRAAIEKDIMQGVEQWQKNNLK